MKKIRLFLWDICDCTTPRHMKTFRAAAWLLALLGDSYWQESADYQERAKA